MSPIIKAFSECAPKKMSALIIEQADKIEAAIASAAEEAQLQESKARLRVSFSTVIDIDANAFDYTLGFAVGHRLIATEAIPDPNQLELLKNNEQE